MAHKDNLDKNKADLLASAAKSVFGILPHGGTFLGELVSNLIPNQRFERLIEYVRVLDEKISKIPIDKLDSLKDDEYFIDLIEEGFVQASRAISDERRQYIASVVSNGISDDQIKMQESKYLLKILQELNDIEIIWLRYFINPTLEGYDDFRDKHNNILTPIYAYSGSDEETINKSAIQESYKEHLERLDLIQHRISVDRKTNLPKFDRNSGKPITSYSGITILGELLLKQIGLIE